MSKTKKSSKNTKTSINDQIDAFGDLEEQKTPPQSQTPAILSKETLELLDQPKIKEPDISWPQVISKYIVDYPARDPDEIGALIRKDYKLTIKRKFPSIAEKNKVKTQITAFNKAFNRAKNFKEGSIHFPIPKTQPSTDKKKSKHVATPSGSRSYNDFDEIFEQRTIHREHIPESQVTKRQKVGEHLEKKITKHVVNQLRVLIDKQLENVDDDEANFSPSQFIKENPIVQLSKELTETTQKAQETAIAIEEGEKKKIDVVLAYKERIATLRKEMGEKVEVIDKALSEMKEGHVRILKRSLQITQTINESIVSINKHHHYE